MSKPFMRTKIIFPALFLPILGVFIFAGCSKSDEQKEFENQAWNLPDNYTSTVDGVSVKNKDPDDWRISPQYQSLIRIGETYTLPHPNPLAFNYVPGLTLDIDVGNIQTLSRVEVNVLDLDAPNPLRQLKVQTVSSTPTLITFTLPGELISASTGGSNASDLYRLIIYDGRNNIISYGDVKVE